MQDDGVPITLEPMPGDASTCTVHVDGKGLNWTTATDTEPRHVQLILMVTTFDKRGKELKRDAKTITVHAPTTVAPTGRLERDLNLIYKVARDPKAIRARFVVRLSSNVASVRWIESWAGSLKSDDYLQQPGVARDCSPD